MSSITRRLTLYAHAIRNQIGRAFGATWAYSPAQVANAKAMWAAFRAHGWNDDTCAAMLGCIEGECSFLLSARGDHDTAGGACQWHAGRRDIIRDKGGIDVWNAGATLQARAIIAEMSAPWSAYRHVELALIAAPDIPAKMSLLLARFEQSGNQPRDLARRVPMAEYWHQRAAQEGWSA